MYDPVSDISAGPQSNEGVVYTLHPLLMPHKVRDIINYSVFYNNQEKVNKSLLHYSSSGSSVVIISSSVQGGDCVKLVKKLCKKCEIKKTSK